MNYEYLFYWKLKQDGIIDFEIKLSGELSTNLLSENELANSIFIPFITAYVKSIVASKF